MISVRYRRQWLRQPILPCLAFIAMPLCAQSPQPPEVPATGQTRSLDFSGAIALGAERNSNLSITELETASGRSDTAATLQAKLDASWKPVAQLSIASGYSYSGSRYRDLDSYDLDLHMVYADAGWDIAGFTLGANYYYAEARLGGTSFLDLDLYSLYAGKLFAGSWYLRGALNRANKDFDVFHTRDADDKGFSVDLFRFFNSGRSNVVVGYTAEDEDTRGAPFAYASDALRLRLNHSFTLASHAARLQLGLRWQERDYRNATPQIGVPRDDSQRVMEARLEVELVENIAVRAGWEHADYDSRLPSADFTNQRVSVAIEASF